MQDSREELRESMLQEANNGGGKLAQSHWGIGEEDPPFIAPHESTRYAAETHMSSTTGPKCSTTAQGGNANLCSLVRYNFLYSR